MKRKQFNNKKRFKKQRKPVCNVFFWIWLWLLWVVLVTTILSFTNSAFYEIKSYYWYWILIAILGVLGIIFFAFWLKNLLDVKATNIKNNQTKLSK